VSDLLGFDGDPLDLIQRDDVVDESQWAPLLVDMVRVVEADIARRSGQAATPAAFAESRHIVLALAEYFGGRQVYLPKGDRLKTALRDAEIWRKFTGRNTRELADEHGLSEFHMYAILKRQRALHARKLQGRLFPD
jgi:Mor family transcriptional regulator